MTTMARDRTLTCFKAYDVRGRIPDELNEEIAYRIGAAYASFVGPKRVAVGRDIRLSSESILDAVAGGLLDSGVDVVDIGLCGTEMVYYATFAHELDGGIMVTASHNPKDYNGLKFVRAQAKPISGDTGLEDIRQLAEAHDGGGKSPKGERSSLDVSKEYVEHLLSYVDPGRMRPLKLVVNSGNGGSGRFVDLLAPHLPFEFVRLHHEPDGTFPNGVPNPMLEENRASTVAAIAESNADLGVAWDGDFDRCFFFDEKGTFIEGYYIVGLLAEHLLGRSSKTEKILHDPRLTWNTIDTVTAHGGVPIQTKCGHAFIKERMRSEDALYGGEMSAHHYFREFAYCDSGMIPWLLLGQLLSERGATLSELVEERMRLFPASGEINVRVPGQERVKEIFAELEEEYSGALNVDKSDGLSLEFADWRFNVRASNTEPVLRLNVESRGDEELMRARTAEIRGRLE